MKVNEVVKAQDFRINLVFIISSLSVSNTALECSHSRHTTDNIYFMILISLKRQCRKKLLLEVPSSNQQVN